jgi:hypothetical protein
MAGFRREHRREAARLRTMAGAATTTAVKSRLLEEADKHERLAQVAQPDKLTNRFVAAVPSRPSYPSRTDDLAGSGYDPAPGIQHRPMMMANIATIECSTCSALLEVYPQDVPGEPSLGCSTRDGELCKAPPLRRYPHAWAEIKRRFPNSDV